MRSTGEERGSMGKVLGKQNQGKEASRKTPRRGAQSAPESMGAGEDRAL